MAAPQRVSFVIPAKDEEKRLGASLRQLIAFVATQPYESEIIVVDDGSTDRTAEIARAAAEGLPERVTLRLLQHDRNKGKGAALRTGVLEAEGDYVLYMDADMAMPPEEAPKLIGALDEGADVAAGSRVQPGGFDMRASQPAYRRIGGRLFAIVRKRLLLADLQDTQCGFKGFRREVTRDVFPRSQLDGWSFDSELLYIAQRLGYRVQQVPVRWEHKEGSQFRLGARAALSELRDLLRIRWLHRGLKAAR
jgi:glycosyltransferase involved in cell wall biosynthesis